MSSSKPNAIERTTAEDVAQVADSKIKNISHVNDDLELYQLTMSYIGKIVAEDIKLRYFDRIPADIAPYIKPFMKQPAAEDSVARAVQESFIKDHHQMFGEPEKDDNREIKVVNVDFSLGYGGMLVLSRTNPRLLKGHRYGLIGGNGAGKTTLLRAIADCKLEGLPTQDVLRSCYVEHGEGEDEDISILEYISTDIYNFEPNKKLAYFRGGLRDFVKVRPDINNYYTLSAFTNIQVHFPPPGILTGVRSPTRAIIRMADVSHTYPNTSKPALIGVSCQLSLSSRVAIIGPNGAGKSTLVKLLNGEVVPTAGTVEHHPNLRIGCIKQHALEHLQLQLNKTANQYLQWRYAYGGDREVHYKRTRILSDADQVQMDKLVNIGDGKGPRQIETLVGRQRHLRGFKYEVKWRGWLPINNTMVTRDNLLRFGFEKLVQAFDDYERSRQGLEYRDLSRSAISKHFKEMGMDPEIAEHYPISSLSGGQMVKVILSATLWPKPHILVLDEPTNSLDRDSLGAVAGTIRDWKGGVVMISHRQVFVAAVASEHWLVKDGRVMDRRHATPELRRFDVRNSQRGAAAKAGNPVPSLVDKENKDNAGREGEMKFITLKKKMTKMDLERARST
ncbi:[NU+] prion formation protein 1 [Exophiala xenobiotica]|nr:[NU+] prion formation protein 1 [Exophiala xenobiotica]KAK5244425.1 [NU+] prion formation protein 1 [Exophiala xenobiotica]KAK5282453.1 [NU+] prion formation protein 1 [Exophiala xenobiotica]KAK5344829.1 [NU+] prion formation protein 1 [Exophiala xenobiotica]KAK5357486.1 [NU+] prion formation protein 1 [Exophiala xenobiotica]